MQGVIRRWVFNFAAVISLLLCGAAVRDYRFMAKQPDFDWMVFDKQIGSYRAATRSEVRWIKESPLLVAGVFAVLPVFWAQIKFRRWVIHRQRMGTNSCTMCGYNLTANTSGVCPECGETEEKGSFLYNHMR